MEMTLCNSGDARLMRPEGLSMEVRVVDANGNQVKARSGWRDSLRAVSL